MDQNISATKLYDHCKCPHKVYNDAFVDQSLKDATSEFLKLLWEKGATHEENIMKDFGDFCDCSYGTWAQREARTKQALQDGAEVIYQGIIRFDNLVGIPDLLIKDNKTYIPCDIKSGRGLDGGDDIEPGILREHYAMGLCVYFDILEKLGYKSDNKIGYIFDVDGDKVAYPLNTPIKMRTGETYWDRYFTRKKEIEDIFDGKIKTTPALGGMCKQCAWYSYCKKEIFAKDDLTKIFYMGRRDRDIICHDLKIKTVDELAKVDLNRVMAIKDVQKDFAGSGFLRGIGNQALKAYIRRAKVYANKKNEPVIFSRFKFPQKEYELFF